ncbi:MAG: aminoglycoside phosphotransferase family protein [Gemmatimonadota bacterium]|nr:aminoglycoside phosphotransferase family protein [Gemmatimonadota bacterium]
MTAPKPLLTYREFVDYDLSLPVAQAICLKAGIPEPTSIRRLKRGEVNAIFLLELSGGDLLVLKVWVRCSDDQVMRREEGVIKIVQRECAVPTPDWVYVSSGDSALAYPHVLIEYAAGVDGDRVWSDIGFEDREKILTQCAWQMRDLHSISFGPDTAAILGNPMTGSEWRESEENRFHGAVGLLRNQGWLGKDTLDRCTALWTDRAESLGTAEVDALVHHDFQLHNLRVDPETLNLIAVLDFGKAKIAPAFTDSRDLHLSVFLTTPEISECFWRTFGMLSAEQELVLKLHSLARVLDILAAYQGPAPGGWDRTTVLKLLD